MSLSLLTLAVLSFSTSFFTRFSLMILSLLMMVSWAMLSFSISHLISFLLMTLSLLMMVSWAMLSFSISHLVRFLSFLSVIVHCTLVRFGSFIFASCTAGSNSASITLSKSLQITSLSAGSILSSHVEFSLGSNFIAVSGGSFNSSSASSIISSSNVSSSPTNSIILSILSGSRCFDSLTDGSGMNVSSPIVFCLISFSTVLTLNILVLPCGSLDLC